ncbi:MAG: glycosyltransferase family 39 protein [Candidatus Alcyoniella australis]|nr:glycosyltransferase family 39 protein [Candidatus Alcyoniella australis]
MTDKRFKIALAAAIIFYVLVRLWAFAGSDNGIDQHHNAFDRALFVVHQWLPDPRIMPDEVYPPVHFYLLAGALSVWNNLELAPRALSLLFSLLTLAPFWIFGRYSAGRNATVLGIVLLAIYPLHVRLSVVSLDSAPFLFFALSGLAMAVLGRQAQSGKAWRYACAGLLLSIAAMTRFEGWLLLPLAPLMTGRRDLRHLPLLWACAAIGPLLYMVDVMRLYNDPLFFLKAAGSISGYHLQRISLYVRLLGWPGVLLSTASGPLLLAIGLGLLLARIERRALWPAALVGLLFCVFELRTLAGSFAYNETKYTALLVIPLLPYGGLAIERIATLRSGRSGIASAAAALAIICGVGLWHVSIDQQRCRATAELESLVGWLRTNVEPDQAVLIGVRDQGYILTRSGLPYDSFLMTSFDEQTGSMDPRTFATSLADPRATFLLYPFFGGTLDFDPFLGFKPDTLRARAHGHLFLLEHRIGHWNIYRILNDDE